MPDSWNLHPRTIDVFLSNNGVFTSFHSFNSDRISLLLKVANSRSTGFDCVSVSCDPSRRTTYALYHHLEDEASVFATLLSAVDQCIDPHSFVAALYRSHHQHIETHRSVIDNSILGILDEYPVLADPKRTIRQLSYCQTDVAIIGHVARCCLDCGEWLLAAIDESEQPPQDGRKQRHGSGLQQRDQLSSESQRAARLMIRQDVVYMRRRTVMLLSQVQQMRDRIQSQISFMLSIITQSDAEYTAAIAVDGKRDSIAMKTISILGIVFLPGTFVAALFSINMFDWGGANSGETSSLTVSRSRWIYWAITVPLTVFTCLVWALWSKRENQKANERLMIYRTNAPIKPESAATTRISSLA